MWLIYVLRKERNYKFVGIIGSIITGLFYLFLIAHGGIEKTAYLWILTYPLIVLSLLGKRVGSFFSIVFFFLSGVVFFLGTQLAFFQQYSPTMIIRLAAVYATTYLIALVTELVWANVQNKLNDIVANFFDSLECRNIKKYHPKVDFEVDLQPDLFNIVGSPVHLSKTIMNLVSNAAEAIIDSGSVHLTTRHLYIDRPLSRYEEIPEGEYVVLTVDDSGSGISSEDIDKIFEPFYTKKSMGRSGTGLGMAVVWGTVKDFNGFIDVNSFSNTGTRIDLYFPVSRRKVSQKENATPVEKYMGSEKVLVIDDVKEQRDIASAMLEKIGYSVTAVSGGEESLKYLASHQADILILDMVMAPGMDGLETYKEIIKLHPNQKAIIASGYAETDRVREAQGLGAGKYIKKPYTMENLGISVRMELDKRPPH
ncbi:MAG: response regulator [Desulfobacterales bacterium]|jgi:CheY-like chemotaxis protein